MCNQHKTGGVQWSKFLADGRPVYLCQQCLSMAYWANHMGEPGCPLTAPPSSADSD